ncbi:MAG: hypothetical protein ACI8ZB_000454 [Desulforhopalus sp.]|jgi:hypothetical protein
MKAKIRVLKGSLFICFVAALLFFIFLPFLCDTYLLPRLIEQLPFSHKELSLSRISLWKIRGTLRLSQGESLVAAIPSFEIQYNPASLLKGKIDTILLDAPTVHLNYTDGTLSVSGQPAKAKSEKPANSSFPPDLPLWVQNIIIRDSHVALHTETGIKDLIVDGRIRLGFDTKNRNKYKLNTLSAEIATEGDLTLKASTQGVFTPQGMLFSSEVNIPNLLDTRNFTPIQNNLLQSGSLTLSGQFALGTQMEISHYLVNAQIDNFRSSIAPLLFTQTLPDSPVHLQLEGDRNRFNYTFSNLSVQEPERIDFEGSGTVELASREFTGLTTAYSKQLNHIFTVDISGSENSGEIHTNLKLTGGTFVIDKDTSMGPLELNGDITYTDGHLNTQLTGNISSIEAVTQEIALRNINWDIPMQYPLEDTPPINKGRFNIESLIYKDVETASLSASVQQTTDGIKYTTNLTSKLGIEGQIQCAGSAFFTGNATAACTLAETAIDTYLMPDYIQTPDDMTFTGKIEADATFEIIDKKQTGQLNLHLTKGSLSSGETKIHGINTTISFPDLPLIKSEPGQLATIELIESGKIQFQKGKVFFRIENEKQLFLEKARLNWCGGKIELGSLNIASDMHDLEATLYCDRLGFAELLKQFGIEDTEGQGSLNGRLPIAINDKGIHFDDGFLFSTPGNSGIVRFNNTDQLRQGMPDIGQTATLDYTIKALNNFAYNWTKLSFNTEGDDLLLAMQLDGKPAEALPFGYKNGQIVATENGPGLQHPVRLDMNFRLPLQGLFRYGKSLQSLMEKM